MTAPKNSNDFVATESTSDIKGQLSPPLLAMSVSLTGDRGESSIKK
jgi:hypothetical protein